MAANKREHRLLIYIMGTALAAIIVTSGIRQYRAAIAALAAPTPEQIVMTAVDKSNGHTDQAVDGANKHTDTQVAMVRSDLKDATAHSDQQISMVRGDLKGAIGTFADLFRKTETDLNISIGKVGKPDPPELAKLQFSFQTPLTDAFPIRTQAVKANQDGTFTIEFIGKNVSTVQARALEIWIQVCNICSFAKEPNNYEKQDGEDARVRHRRWGALNPGVYMLKTSVDVRLPGEFPAFDTSFAYSCENCGGDRGWSETIRTIVMH